MHPFVPVPPDGTLGVFAPSSPFDGARFETGIEILKGLGFYIHIHPQAYARSGFLAGDDAQRADAFFSLLEDPSIDGVMAARGGYGAHRLLFDVDASRAARHRKPVIGFSDVVVLHQILQGTGLMSIHGPVVTQLGDLDQDSHLHLARLLRGQAGRWTLTADRAGWAPEVIAGGVATGPLVGGCLAVLAALVGTPHLFVPNGAILLLEDVGEVPYRLDRMLTHLRLAGILDRVSGLALGDFVNCRPPRPVEPGAEDVLTERLGSLGVPVVSGLPIGHGKRNMAVPLGATATLDGTAGTLTLHDVSG